ncbi:phage tail assembly protein [Psychrobacter alimentarius]|uniref:phage tail assembly protein n=1 Tax=Psychrobacter alimentarius TaxID=261164 RepID=UPI003FD57892|tara:strand:+ start:17450 stop:17878 length:429 start_codon:yes stop_codon:yes gene_type:complete
MSKKEAVEAIATSSVAPVENSQTDTATPPALPVNPDIETVEFDTPIIRGNLTISEVNINKPKTGALRGLSLADLLKVDVDTVIKLVPRVSTPPLTENEVAALDPADFLSVSTAVVGFFASKDQRKKTRLEAETAKAEASPTA